MSKNNTKCKTCGKIYHNCASCSCPDYEYDFCDFKCLEVYRKVYMKDILDKYGLTVEKYAELVEEMEQFYL